MKFKILLLSTLTLVPSLSYNITPAFAGEDLGTTAKNSAGDVATAGKKTGRWASRQARKITGQDSQSKSEKDRALNEKDELQNDANKAENRAKENQ